jgi:hypothetical protein
MTDKCDIAVLSNLYVFAGQILVHYHALCCLVTACIYYLIYTKFCKSHPNASPSSSAVALIKKIVIMSETEIY